MFKKCFFFFMSFYVFVTCATEQKKIEQALHKACYNFDMQAIEFYLSSGVDCNCNADDEDGWTPLHIACDTNYEALVPLLIKTYKAKVNVVDQQNSTPLHKACYKGNLNIVTMLVQAGADVVVPDSQGALPLHLCRGVQACEIAELLLYHRSPLNVCDSFDFTPLDFACSSDNKQLIDLLISHGAGVQQCNFPSCSTAQVQCKYLIALHDNQALNMLVQQCQNASAVQEFFVHAFFHKNRACYMKLLASHAQTCQRSTSSEFFKKLSCKDQQELGVFLRGFFMKNSLWKNVRIVFSE